MIPVDVCVAMQGKNLDLLARIFLKSMLKVVNTDGLTLHVVDNGILPEHYDDLRVMLYPDVSRRMDVQLHSTRYIDFKVRHGWDQIDISKYAAANCAAVCEWMLDHCGSNEWCLISHFDIQFLRDIISTMRNRVTASHGLLGSHCPMMLVNRTAWKQCRIPFRNFDYYYAVPTDERHRLRHASDVRRKSTEINVGGFDVGELFELVLPGYGWTCEAMEDDIAREALHIRSGSGWMNNDDIDRSIRRHAERIIEREGY